MSRPLRSTRITRASPLLRAGPPTGAASVLNASRFLPLGVLPATHCLPWLGPQQVISSPAFPRSMQKPQTGLTPPLCRTPPGQEHGHSPDSSRDLQSTPVSMPSTHFDTSSAVRLRSPFRSPP